MNIKKFFPQGFWILGGLLVAVITGWELWTLSWDRLVLFLVSLVVVVLEILNLDKKLTPPATPPVAPGGVVPKVDASRYGWGI
jgi:hypothetical protein